MGDDYNNFGKAKVACSCMKICVRFKDI